MIGSCSKRESQPLLASKRISPQWDAVWNREESGMKIQIRPIGLLQRFANDSEIEGEAGLTPRKLIASLGIPAELKIVSFVNGTRIDPDYELHEGDHVKLVALLTGG